MLEFPGFYSLSIPAPLRRNLADAREVIGPVDHQVLLSIYFFDPTSNCRLELTTPLTRLSDQDAQAAEKALDQWEALRDEATASGVGFGDFLRQKLQMRAKHVA